LTLSFFLIQTLAAERGEAWPDTALCTTSHLERENRNFRRRLRQAVLFPSILDQSGSKFTQNTVVKPWIRQFQT
jgi:hypothetical protein